MAPFNANVVGHARHDCQSTLTVLPHGCGLGGYNRDAHEVRAFLHSTLPGGVLARLLRLMLRDHVEVHETLGNITAATTVAELVARLDAEAGVLDDDPNA